jgi:hypothetical protein
MPRGDRRGPEGAGPMTGRGLGYCVGNDRPGFAANAAPQGFNRSFRGGAGRGPGRGMGYGRGYGIGYARMNAPAYEQPTAEESTGQTTNQAQIERLENTASNLQNQLEEIKTQLNELKKD